jgi:hypothetical protein
MKQTIFREANLYGRIFVCEEIRSIFSGTKPQTQSGYWHAYGPCR